MTLSSKEIRQGFIDFFKGKEHAHIPSSPVFPKDDPTLLFTNAGMNQFKDYFLGHRPPQATRAVNSQKCIRVSGKHNDLEEVGRDTYHHTFFEMLGNWSFGDYFKEDAIRWAWELLTVVWGMAPDRLWATVFGGDAQDGLDPDFEAEQLWLKHTPLPKNRVLRFGRKDNFWEMGETGPCGPCSEIHIDRGPQFCDRQDEPRHICQVNGSCGRFIELWNLVFIQYNRDDKGVLSELPSKHIDTGAGLERVVSVLQGKASNYDTDLFTPLFEALSDMTGLAYHGDMTNERDIAFRVIGDHLRMLSVAIADGALPGNDGRGYVLRRVLRRATRFGLKLDMHEPFLYKLIPTLCDILGEVYPELNERANHIATVIEAEEASFGKTLERGMELFEADLTELQQQKQTVIPGEKAFQLYDTYGFPLDLTELMARERGFTVNTDTFETLMNQQRQRARASQKNTVYQGDSLSSQLPTTQDSDKYERHVIPATILGYVLGNDYLTSGAIPTGVEVGLVLDKTCAYAEAGGQIGDKGTIQQGQALFRFNDTRRIGNAIVHVGMTSDDGLDTGQQATVRIDPERQDTARNHTATHLLQWALQEVLGSHVRQEGSLVCPDYLRFDFTHPKALTPEQIARIERLVNQRIEEDCPVTFETLPIDQAREIGAMALFSEKYGDNVRVLAIGTEDMDELEKAFSKEFCGGTHVHHTRDIGGFKVTREESVATGVRRITALTGRSLNHMLNQHSDRVERLCQQLKVTPEQLEDRVQSIIDENKTLKKQLKKGAASDLKASAEELLAKADSLGEAKVIIGTVPDAPVEQVRQNIDWFRQKAPSSVVVLAMASEAGKAILFVAVTDDLVSQGLKAGDIVRDIAPLVGGGGGGKPQMAQAGGKNPDGIPQALEKAKSLINQVMQSA